VNFAAGNFTANGAMTWTVASARSGDLSAYSIVGKTLTIWFSITGTVGGTPNSQLLIAIPGGFTAAAAVQTVCESFQQRGRRCRARLRSAANGTTIIVFNSTSASPG
jgi:hypothetical protein